MAPRIELDPATFDPWKIQAVTHRLVDHPLLQIDALVELGKRLAARRLVRTHSADATAGTSFADAPNLHPNRALIGEILDEIRPIVEERDPGMCYRAGWIFVSSPGAVTPFHIDHEHNFIMQIRGTKRLYTWDPFDREVVSERAQELFHDQHSREEVRWRDDLRDRARVFDLAPGLGGYMPSTTPHMVENGPGPSITISFTYYTDSTRRRELLYRGNARLRRLGLAPRPIGASAVRDRVAAAVLGGYTAARGAVRKALGRGVRDNGVPYAPA
jgi:hypothetical protein